MQMVISKADEATASPPSKDMKEVTTEIVDQLNIVVSQDPNRWRRFKNKPLWTSCSF